MIHFTLGSVNGKGSPVTVAELLLKLNEVPLTLEVCVAHSEWPIKKIEVDEKKKMVIIK